MSKVVAISGYFNPLHEGHLNYIDRARELGTELWVIVNNDHQVRLKGSVPFMDEVARVKIMEQIKGVDMAILSVDKDRSVCKTLKRIEPDIFATGADHNAKEKLAEVEVCKKLGITIVYGVGGRKVQSSSKLIKKCKKHA